MHLVQNHLGGCCAPAAGQARLDIDPAPSGRVALRTVSAKSQGQPEREVTDNPCPGWIQMRAHIGFYLSQAIVRAAHSGVDRFLQFGTCLQALSHTAHLRRPFVRANDDTMRGKSNVLQEGFELSGS